MYICRVIFKVNVMASINQIVSEIAHSVQGAYTVPVRRALRLAVIHARNELIRHSFTNHRYTDKVLQQRFRVTLINVPDGDIDGTKLGDVNTIKRTLQKVPRPTRLDNNLPFHSVRTTGVTNPIEIPFVKEASSKYYDYLPGMCPTLSYDYINDYIYIMYSNMDKAYNLLDEDYRNKKFGNVDNYKNYIKTLNNLSYKVDSFYIDDIVIGGGKII